MNAPSAVVSSQSPDWHGPGATAPARRRFDWHAVLWALVFPRKRHRIALTAPGVFLVALALGIGTAAYNTASNILFIALSLLLACLLLSGLLSWFNFRGVCWRMRPPGPWRAGHETLVSVEVANTKSWLPTYSLWFEFAARPSRLPEPENPGREPKVRELLAEAEKHVFRGRVPLRERLEPGGGQTLEWGVRPVRRGETRVELLAVGSLFPFGFLRKHLGTEARQTVLVWPAQVDYTWTGGMAAHQGTQGRRTSRAGTGDDLLALRKYQSGDSHRQIHWKASARLGRLMVRQFAEESHDGYVLSVDASAELWPRAEQFELLCSFAGMLAEDLFAAGRLRAVGLVGGVQRETRRVRDVEAWLDCLARLEFGAPGRDREDAGSGFSARPEAGLHLNVITFAPDGARGVVALIHGRKIASA